MGLFGLFKPKWQSKNPEVRLTAVRGMGEADLSVLRILAVEDEDPRVRRAAAQRIDDPTALEELATRATDPAVLEELRARLDRHRFAAVFEGTDPAAGELVDRIGDPDLIARLAVEAPTPALRLRALPRIEDPETLCRVVEQNCGKEPARAAVARLDDPDLLRRVARTGASKVTRRLAEEKLAALTEADRPRDEQPSGAGDQRPGAGGQGPGTEDRPPVEAEVEEAAAREAAQRREWLRAREEAVGAVEALAEAPDGDADEGYRAARERWAAAEETDDDPAFAALAERFERACRRYEEIRERRIAEREQLARLGEEADRIEAQLTAEDLDGARDAVADLARRLGAAEFRWADPESLRERIEAVRRRCEELLAARAAAAEERARQEAVERRRSLCEELEGLVDAEDRAAAGRRVKTLRKAWNNLPDAGAEGRADEERFRAALERFSARQATFHEEQEWRRWANKTRQEELCAEVEALDAEEDLAVVAERVKDAQRRWKEVGPVPRAEAQALWERFKAACDRNFERCRPHFEELERRRAEAVARKEALCVEAETHVDSTRWKESADALKALQAAWKEAGPAPRRQDRELYARFRRACDRFFERREAHFAELDEKRRGNQAEKEKLCERAEALAAEPDPARAREFRDLQAEWKRVGPAPRDTEQALWERLRAAADRFFAALDEGRQENLRRKEALCAEAEVLVAEAADDADPRAIAAQITDLQKRWKEIGPVPREESDAIWERFRRPCDAFFAARREQFEALDAERRANEERKLEILHRAEELAEGDDAKAAAEGLRELQEQWNALGPATRDREAELRQRFRTVCDDFFEGRRQHFEELNRARQENLKEKEALCVRLERVVGAASGEAPTRENQALSLAEQLKLAFASNFALSGDQDTPERRLEEVRSIQDAWQQIGPVPREHDRALWARYRSLLDAFYGSRREGAEAD